MQKFNDFLKIEGKFCFKTIGNDSRNDIKITKNLRKIKKALHDRPQGSEGCSDVLQWLHDIYNDSDSQRPIKLPLNAKLRLFLSQTPNFSRIPSESHLFRSSPLVRSASLIWDSPRNSWRKRGVRDTNRCNFAPRKSWASHWLPESLQLSRRSHWEASERSPEPLWVIL